MSSAVAAACGVVALSALTVPAAHADERFGDTDITGVVVNDGNPVVVGTGARTVTAEVTATDPSGLQQVNATLYHGPFGAPGSTVASTAACGPTVATTTTCTLTFTLTPGTAPADDSLAGDWHLSAYAIAPDSDAVFLDSAATVSVLRDSQVTVEATPKPGLMPYGTGNTGGLMPYGTGNTGGLMPYGTGNTGGLMPYGTGNTGGLMPYGATGQGPQGPTWATTDTRPPHRPGVTPPPAGSPGPRLPRPRDR
ncbi:hypothetical protein [Streptomyces sp. Ag82_O1-15]|uniref:hypothetical protein n=1 Tax=Streptomyces sp. Ag82_O1-15 TaxID=1938855 RepID=UPI000BB16710|nr:hypothetical protein [Streptomyces sp. Ag82_O1-15]